MSLEKKPDRSSSSGSRTAVEHEDVRRSIGHDTHQTLAPEDPAKDRLGFSKKLANPLAGLNQERLAAMGEDYAKLAGLTSDEDMRAFRLGAMIAGDHTRYDTIPELTDREREVLERETTHKWSNPSMLYWVIVSKLSGSSKRS